MTRRLAVLAGALLALAVGLSVVLSPAGSGGSTAAPTGSDDRAAPAPSATPGAAEDEVVVPGRGSLAAAGETAPEATAPAAVRIPGIEVSSPLETLRTDEAGRLRSPQEWQSAGWFAEGTPPGEIGPAVIAGHVDSPTGPAVFARLAELRPGDLVTVERADGSTVDFRVDRTEVVPQAAFPTAEVYGPTPDAQLRLITCDGPYLRSSGGYQDNRVVWASAVTA